MKLLIIKKFNILMGCVIRIFKKKKSGALIEPNNSKKNKDQLYSENEEG